MRELYLVSSDSTDTSLVFTTEEGEEFFFAVNDDLRALCGPAEDPEGAGSPAAVSPLSSVATAGPTEGTGEDSGKDSGEGSGESTAGNAPLGSATPAAPSTPSAESTPQAQSAAEAPRSAMNHVTSVPPKSESSHAMPLRPNEIQARIRAGASAAELAEELSLPESRIEPFAHPVLLERARIADVAKQAHPVRENGPAKLTLWEILATAFAARGHSLSESTWDAYRHQGEPWVVRVTWRAGLSENEAEWTFKQTMSSPATVEARNSVAADLTDPDFVQPVRSLTSVGRGERYDKAIDGQHPADYYEDEAAGTVGMADVTDLTAPTVLPGAMPAETPSPHGAQGAPAAGGLHGTRGSAGKDSAGRGSAGTDSEDITRDDIPMVPDRASAPQAEGEKADEDFFQNPDPEPKPTKRRRKAVTPHWEDVLLGVRSNTKRPRE